MMLAFDVPPAFDRIREAFEALAAVLVGAPQFDSLSREALHDPNGGGAAFVARWGAAGATYEERVEGGSGNPRDGYGYDVALTLTLPDGGTVRHTGSAWEPAPVRLQLRVSGVRPSLLATMRAALVARLGAAADRSAEPHLALENAQALEAAGEKEEAMALATEGVTASGRHTYGRAELVEWIGVRTLGGDAVSTRVREAPASLDAWLAALDAPPRGYTRALVVEALARLCPFDGDRRSAAGVPSAAGAPSSGWHRAHLEAAGLEASLVEEACAALTGWRGWRDWQQVQGEVERRGGWTMSVSRFARYAEHATLPTVRVDVSRTPSRAKEGREAWSYIPGPETADLLVVTRRYIGRRSVLMWCVEGSDAFRERAAGVMDEVTPFAWHPCSFEEGRTPWVSRPPVWLTAGERWALALAAMHAAGVPERDELAPCGCEQPIGYCEHRRLILDAARRWLRLAAETRDAREAAFARARGHALTAAFEASGASPSRAGAKRNAEATALELRIAEAMRAGR